MSRESFKDLVMIAAIAGLTIALLDTTTRGTDQRDTGVARFSQASEETCADRRASFHIAITRAKTASMQPAALRSCLPMRRSGSTEPA